MCPPAPAPNAAAAPDFFLPSLRLPSAFRWSLPLLEVSKTALPHRLVLRFSTGPSRSLQRDDHGATVCHPRSRSRLLPLKWCCWPISNLPVPTFPIGRPHLGSCFGHILARFQAKTVPLYNGHVSHSPSPLLQPPCLFPSLFQIPSPSLPNASTANSSRTAVVSRYGPRRSSVYLLKVPFLSFPLASDPHLSSPQQGLYDYCNSPFATHPSARGRNRSRNQFLVDYLLRHGIFRTKKQTSSHLQVLKNMWKGEPGRTFISLSLHLIDSYVSEYWLVAGGEEVANVGPPVGSSIKLEDHHWSSGLIPMDFDDHSSKSASPDVSPPEPHNQFLPDPDHLPTCQLDLRAGLQYSSETTQNLVSSVPQYHTSFHDDYSTFSTTYSQVQPMRRDLSVDVNGSSSSSVYKYANRVRAIRLSANGMSPFIIRTDVLIPLNLPYEPLQLKIRLSLSNMHDVNCPPAFDGFLASICFSHVWSSSAKCITKTCNDSTIVSEHMAALEITDITQGAVNALIPESHLNRCRWIDPRMSPRSPHNLCLSPLMCLGSATTILQEIIIDDVSLLSLIYELDRTSGNPVPSAQFIGFLKYPFLHAGSSDSIQPSFPNRPFASLTRDSGVSSIRGFSDSPINSSSSAGLPTIVHPSSYPYNPLSNTYYHPAAMVMSNSDDIGSSDLHTDSVPMHSHHGRQPNQSLAQALTPVRASS